MIERRIKPRLLEALDESPAAVLLGPARRFVVYPGQEAFRLKEDIVAIPLRELAALLGGQG